MNSCFKNKIESFSKPRWVSIAFTAFPDKPSLPTALYILPCRAPDLWKDSLSSTWYNMPRPHNQTKTCLESKMHVPWFCQYGPFCGNSYLLTYYVKKRWLFYIKYETRAKGFYVHDTLVKDPQILAVLYAIHSLNCVPAVAAFEKYFLR